MVPPSLRLCARTYFLEALQHNINAYKKWRLASRLFGRDLFIIEHCHVVLDKKSARSRAEFLL
jgi:hypothetical protein